MSHISSLLLSLALLSLPIAIWAEKEYPEFWEERIAVKSFEYEPKRQDIYYHDGTSLPSRIEENLTLNANDNPIILEGAVTVFPEATLTIEAGTDIYTTEFSYINAEGSLRIKGEKDNPVNFYSNQKHPAKQSFGGLIFTNKSTGTIEYATIRYGSPAISCLSGSQVNISNTRLHMGEVGLLSFSENCNITKSIIHGVRDGIITDQGANNLNTNRINGYRNNIHVVKKRDFQ